MKRLQHIATVSLCMALLATSPIRSAGPQDSRSDNYQSVNEKLDRVSQEEIDSKKTSMIISTLKAIVTFALVAGASQIPWIKGSGFETGLIAAAFPAAGGALFDDPAMKIGFYSTAAGCTLIGGAGGFLVNQYVLRGLQKVPLISVKSIADILIAAKIPANAAGAVTVAGAAGVHLGKEAYNKIGRHAAAAQIALEQYFSGYKNKEKASTKTK